MDIDQILSVHKPHIFSLCEANIDRITNDTLKQHIPRLQHRTYKNVRKNKQIT